MGYKRHLLNFSSIVIGNWGARVIALLTVPYAARTLGPDGIGTCSLVNAIAEFVAAFVAFGYPTYAAREYARLENVSVLFNPMRSLQLVLSVLGTFALVAVALISGKGSTFTALAALAGLTLIIASLDPYDVMIAKGKASTVAYRKILGQLIFAALLFGLVRSPGDLVWYGVAVAGSAIIPAFLGMRIYRAHYGTPRFSLKFDNWAKIVRESVPLGLARLSDSTNNYLGSVMCGLMLSTVMLGYYEISLKVVSCFLDLFAAILLVAVPEASRLYIENRTELGRALRTYFFITLFCCLASSIALVAFARPIILLLAGPRFLDSVPLLRLLAGFWLPASALAIFFAASLVPLNASKHYMYASAAGTIVSLTGLVALTHRFAVTGVVCAQILAKLCVLALALRFFIQAVRHVGLDPRSVFSVTGLVEDARATVFARWNRIPAVKC